MRSGRRSRRCCPVSPPILGRRQEIGCSLRRCCGACERARWRDLPSDFGNWNSVFQRFRRWVKGGVVERVFACLSDEPDFEYALVDGAIVTAHGKASGAKG